MKYLIAIIGCGLWLNSAQAEFVFQFKNPSFSGVGWSNHVLTIETLEKSRRDALSNERKAEQARIENEFQNTPLQRFYNLFTSQVYSQLASQLTNSLFKDNCLDTAGNKIANCTNPSSGTFALDGNTVAWAKSTSEITLTVVDRQGTITELKVPIASFAL